jgi:hypothetical protein
MLSLETLAPVFCLKQQSKYYYEKRLSTPIFLLRFGASRPSPICQYILALQDRPQSKITTGATYIDKVRQLLEL